MVIDLNDNGDDGNGNGDDKKERIEDAKERKLDVNVPVSRVDIRVDRMDEADIGKEESNATKEDMPSKACSDPELKSVTAKEMDDGKKPVDLGIATDRPLIEMQPILMATQWKKRCQKQVCRRQ